MTQQETERPDGLEDDHLYYLDLLRETGVTNMFGAASYLVEEFDIDSDTARKYLSYWMRTFGERHAQA
jgi:hypothetical protein